MILKLINLDQQIPSLNLVTRDGSQDIGFNQSKNGNDKSFNFQFLQSVRLRIISVLNRKSYSFSTWALRPYFANQMKTRSFIFQKKSKVGLSSNVKRQRKTFMKQCPAPFF